MTEKRQHKERKKRKTLVEVSAESIQNPINRAIEEQLMVA
jgi:hypothetical protein